MLPPKKSLARPVIVLAAPVAFYTVQNLTPASPEEVTRLTEPRLAGSQPSDILGPECRLGLVERRHVPVALAARFHFTASPPLKELPPNAPSLTNAVAI